MIGPGARARPRSRRRGGGVRRALVLLLAGAVVFVLGVGFGQALGDADPPRGMQTLERTLEPRTVGDTVTVTVTVTAP